MKTVMLTSDFFDTGHGGVEGHILGLTRAILARYPTDEVVVVRAAPRPIQSSYSGTQDGIDYRPLPSVSRSAGRAGISLPGADKLGLLIEFTRRVFRGMLSARKVDEFIDTVGGDFVVHQHDFLESWGLTRRLAARGYAVFWTNHLGEFIYLRSLPFGKYLLRLLTRHYRMTFAPSEELADVSAISGSVIRTPNGVDTGIFRPAESRANIRSIRAELGWPSDVPVVVVPRRWAPTKGVVFVAEAMTLPHWPRCHVVFAGSGTAEYPGYRERIMEYLTSTRSGFEIHERVDQETMARMLRAADFCLVPSVKEATSLSALEAMASRTVVVAARVGGMPEIIEDEVTGFLHASGSANELVGALNRAMAGDVDAISAAALRLVQEDYSWERVAVQVRRAYGESCA